MRRGAGSAKDCSPEDPASATLDPANQRWYSALPATTCCGGVPADRVADDLSDSGSCVSGTEDQLEMPAHASETHLPVKRQLPSDTLLDLTTPSTNVSCQSSRSNERECQSRCSSEPVSAISAVTGSNSRPGSSRLPVPASNQTDEVCRCRHCPIDSAHTFLPPFRSIRQMRSADAVIVQIRPPFPPNPCWESHLLSLHCARFHTSALTLN